MSKGQLRKRIKAGESVFGIFCDIPSPQIVEMIGLAGYDFVFLDAEHTAATPETVEHMVRAAESRGLSTVTRVAFNHHASILRYVDTGTEGVLIPLIDTEADVHHIVDSVKYPPLGKRGLAHVRAADYAMTGSLGSYARRENENTFISVQIETPEAVRNLEAICESDELDAVFFGTTDLAMTMGYSAQLETSGSNHPDIIRLVLELGEKVMKSGKAVGISAHSPEAYERWKRAGFQICATVASLQFVAGARGLLQECGLQDKSPTASGSPH